MKNILIAAAVLSATFAFAEGDAPAETPAYPVSVVVDDATNTYNLAVVADADDVKGAKSYIDSYADNVQNDKEFKANEAKALATIRTENRFFGTWWAIFPPLLAIFLALITKEVYSSLFIGIVSGGLLYSGFALEGTMTHVVKDGFIGSIADGYNIGILFRRDDEQDGRVGGFRKVGADAHQVEDRRAGRDDNTRHAHLRRRLLQLPHCRQRDASGH